MHVVIDINACCIGYVDAVLFCERKVQCSYSGTLI